MTNLYRFRDDIYNEHSMIPPLQNLCYNSSTCVDIFGFQSDAWKCVYAFFPRYFEFYRKLHIYYEKKGGKCREVTMLFFSKESLQNGKQFAIENTMELT